MTVLGGAHAPIAACWSPMWAQASPRGYIIIFSKSAFAQTERRTACHFTETNVQKCIKVKTISSSLLSRALLFFSVPKKQIRLKGVGVPSCLCVILRRVIITICRKIKWFFFSFSLCVPSYSSRSLASTLSSRYSPVTGSMSPGSASQILARKKRRGVSGLGHWMLVGSVSFSVESATQFAFFFLCRS